MPPQQPEDPMPPSSEPPPEEELDYNETEYIVLHPSEKSIRLQPLRRCLRQAVSPLPMAGYLCRASRTRVAQVDLPDRI
jgi:hypothetical protein